MWNMILQRTLELSGAIPGAILCILPMKNHLHIRGRSLALWGIPALLLWTAVGGALCGLMELPSYAVLLPSLCVFCYLLTRFTDLPGWKTVSVLLAVCAEFSYMTCFSIEICAIIRPDEAPFPLTVTGAAIFSLLCWLMMLLSAYPATHAARSLLADVEMPGTWYGFWVLPVVFLVLSWVLRPRSAGAMYRGNFLAIYPVLILVLLMLLLFCYFMFYLMACGLGRNMRLQQENHLLQLQASQYAALKSSIDETRRFRHDLRHHFQAVQGYLQTEDIDGLKDYIAKYQQTMPIPLDEAQVFCRNAAVNATLWFYAGKAAQCGVDMDISAQMEPRSLIPEPELCVLLGNLLENALAACEALEKDRYIRVKIRQTGSSMLAVMVDNPCPQPPVWEHGGLRSSKHKGLGIGTDSVRAIARRYNGDARFEWVDGEFHASVLLNPPTM